MPAADAVVVFSQTYCPFSRAVKRELDARGVGYTAFEGDELPGGNVLVNELGKATGPGQGHMSNSVCPED